MDHTQLVITLPEWLPLPLWQFWTAGLAGLFANYLSKKLKGELVARNLFAYLFIDHPALTAASVLTMLAAGFAAMGVGGLLEMKITTVVATGFTSGWALDACINRGKPKDDNFDPATEKRV